MACLYGMAKNSQIQPCMLSGMPALLISLLIYVFISTAKIRKKCFTNRFQTFKVCTDLTSTEKRQILNYMHIDLYTFLMHVGWGGKGTDISLISLFCRMHQTLPTALY